MKMQRNYAVWRIGIKDLPEKLNELGLKHWRVVFVEKLPMSPEYMVILERDLKNVQKQQKS